MLALKIKCACIAINVKKIKFNSLLVVAMTTGASVLMLHRMTGTVLGDGYCSRIQTDSLFRYCLVKLFLYFTWWNSYIFVPANTSFDNNLAMANSWKCCYEWVKRLPSGRAKVLENENKVLEKSLNSWVTKEGEPWKKTGWVAPRK
jgi:hypothetical protein